MKNHRDWKAIGHLLPYLWQFKWRVIISLALLTLAKIANVSVPFALKGVVDALDPTQQALIYLPIAMIIAYGTLRLASSLFNELRDALFATVIFPSTRCIAGKIFKHLHHLSLRFHLQRQTGGISRDIERGTRGVTFLLNFMVFNILPTLVEIGMVTIILLSKYNSIFAIITSGTIVAYIVYTLVITEWRMRFRRLMNDMDSNANNRAIDSLLNYETVKYFNNEDYELKRYDTILEKWANAAIKSQASLSLLNIGQGAIIAAGLTMLMLIAGKGVISGELTLGDLVLLNAFLLQLYLPLGFLGFVYREIRHSLLDIERMFHLIDEPQEIKDDDDVTSLSIKHGAIEFNQVYFQYDSDRPILNNINFKVMAGKKVAIVGASGSGKSTLVRLLFRFYDPRAGHITIDGVNIRHVRQHSLRQVIGIVPQDTVLFNDTIYYNILYGNPLASEHAVIDAAKRSHIHDFIVSLPKGYDTCVGERGLKLSGGEKQRIAIARALLKNPHILIFDEATSALDSQAEKAINAELKQVSANKTTLAIAHRLSTITDADTILVMEQGNIIEQGTHDELLQRQGRYAVMWALQQKDRLKAG